MAIDAELEGAEALHLLKQARSVYSVEDAVEAEGEASAGANTGDAEDEDTGEVEVEAKEAAAESGGAAHKAVGDDETAAATAAVPSLTIAAPRPSRLSLSCIRSLSRTSS